MTFLFTLIAFLTITGILPVLVFLLVTRLKLRLPRGLARTPNLQSEQTQHTLGLPTDSQIDTTDNAKGRDTRSKRVLATALVFVLSILGVELAPWLAPHPVGDVSKMLGRSLREYPRECLSLSEFTRFEWTEVLVFPDYSNRKDICNQLRIRGWDCWWLAPDRVREGERFLVFVDGTKVMHAEFHTTRNAHFKPYLFPVARFAKGAKFQVTPGTGDNPPTLRRVQE